MSTLTKVLGIALVAAVGVAAWQFSVYGGGQDQLGLAEVTVYKSATCGCCGRWVDHLRSEGFIVTAVDVPDLNEVKALNGVPGDLQSCHTAIVGDYVIEGHVPAADIRRLLSERPAIAGIAVPGMPMGSPGMEGDRVDPYDVIAFSDTARTIFASH